MADTGSICTPSQRPKAMIDHDPTPHKTLRGLVQNPETWPQAIALAASTQDWELEGCGNPIHTMFENAPVRCLLDFMSLSVCFQDKGSAPIPSKPAQPPERVGFDLKWLIMSRESDGATPLHDVFRSIIEKKKWFKPQDGMMNGQIVQFHGHAEALRDAWDMACIFERLGGDFLKEDHQGVSLGQLIVDADRSLNPAYPDSWDRKQMRKLEVMLDARSLESNTKTTVHTRPLDRL